MLELVARRKPSTRKKGAWQAYSSGRDGTEAAGFLSENRPPLWKKTILPFLVPRVVTYSGPQREHFKYNF